MIGDPMNFIKLTCLNGDSLWVSVDHIVSLQPTNNSGFGDKLTRTYTQLRTTATQGYSGDLVQETPEEILAMLHPGSLR